MSQNKYSAASVKYSFWFLEFRTTVQYLCDGKTLDEIKQLNEEINIYNASSRARAKLIFNIVSARIRQLDSSFTTLFCNSDLRTQKVICLVSILKHESLFFDFFHEVIQEQMIIGTNELSDTDMRIFFKQKQVENDRVAGWSTETVTRLSSTYKDYLTHAGLLDGYNGKKETTRKLYPPILDQSFADWLQAHELGYMVNLLSGVR